MASAVDARRLVPSAPSLLLTRLSIELKQFMRSREAVFFTLGFPLMILILFGLLFNENLEGTDITFAQYLVGGIVASGIVAVGFQSLSISVGLEQYDGTIKRLAATPMSAIAYLLGKVAFVFVIAVGQTAVLVTIGYFAYDIDLPEGFDGWITFGWVFVLGTVACTMLGFAYSKIVRSPKSAGPVTTLPFIVLQFISGVYVPFNQVPDWLQTVASFFPLRWMALGFRSVFLPAEFASQEPGGGWQHGMTALVLGLWCIAGFVIAARSFRWRIRERKLHSGAR